MKCPVCDKEMERSGVDYTEHILCEECYECPDKHFHFHYWYGHYDMLFSDGEEFGYSYTTPEEQVNRVEENIKAHAKKFNEFLKSQLTSGQNPVG